MFVELQLDTGEIKLQYVPTPEGHKTLPRLDTGIYKPTFDHQGTLFFHPMAVSEERLVDLNTEPAELIRDEITGFFDQTITGRLRAARVAHRRAILLYGPPGTGKTSLVRAMFPSLLANNAVILIDPDVSALETRIIPAIRLTDPDRAVVVVFDEFTNVARGGGGTYVLRLLDGLSSPQNIVFFGTTNHIHLLPAAMRSRPSRFSLTLEIDKLPLEAKVKYAMVKYGEILEEQLVRELATATVDMALDYLEEACKLALMGKSVETIAARFKTIDTTKAVQKGREEDEDDDF